MYSIRFAAEMSLRRSSLVLLEAVSGLFDAYEVSFCLGTSFAQSMNAVL